MILALSIWISALAWAAPPVPQAGEHRALLNQYCITGHNQRTKTAGLSLETIDLSNAEMWEKVLRKVRSGIMPPRGVPRPEEGPRKALISWLEAQLDLAAAAKPNPGRPLLHRLNRAEYANAIRDLLALDVDTASLLPPGRLRLRIRQQFRCVGRLTDIA